MIAAPKLAHRVVFFTGIGAFSAGIHVGIVLILVAWIHVPPLVANMFGFLIAFNVSFLGHKHLTFHNASAGKQLSLPHFFMVAATAGLINECLYFLVLRYTSLNYLLALVLVLGLVAVYSFILSRFWALR